jgi:adenylate kinase
MHYYVVGVNGSGKTSVLNAIHERTNIEVIQGTHALMRQLGIPGDYEALRALDQTRVLTEWSKTAEKLVRAHGTKPFLLDTHILNLTGGKVIRRDGPWIAHYDALVLIKAAPATIISRIVADPKERALFSANTTDEQKVAIIDDYQEKTERLFNELAIQFKLPYCVLDNDTDLKQAAEDFIRFDESLNSN